MTNLIISTCWVAIVSTLWITSAVEGLVSGGCYKDNRDRVLDGQSTKFDDNSPSRCSEYCQNYLYYGVESEKECRCGNTLKYLDKKSESECDKSCPGDSSKKCGGSWKMNLYKNELTNILGKTSCPFGSDDCNNCATDVLHQFNNLKHHGEVLGFHMAPKWVDNVEYSLDGGSHWQGIARLSAGKGRYLALTTGPDDNGGLLRLVKMGSRNEEGVRFRSNRIEKEESDDEDKFTEHTEPEEADRGVWEDEVNRIFKHGGGIQSIGSWLAVTMDQGTTTASEDGSIVQFYNFRNLDQDSLELDQKGPYISRLKTYKKKAGAVAVTKLSNGTYLVAVGGFDGGHKLDIYYLDSLENQDAYTKNTLKHCWDDKYGYHETIEEAEVACENDDWCQGIYDNKCDNQPPFYLCPLSSTYSESDSSCIYNKEMEIYNQKPNQTLNFEDEPVDLIKGGCWPRDGQFTECGWSFQGMSFINQCSDGKVFLLGMQNNGGLGAGKGKDKAYLYEVMIRDGRLKLQEVGRKEFHCSWSKAGTNCNFVASGSAFVDSDKNLILYSSEHANDGPDDTVKMVEYRNMDGNRQGTCNEDGSSWIELYEDKDFEGRSIVLDYSDQALDNFEDLNKVDDFGDKASSMRWCIKSGCTATIYEWINFNNAGDKYDLSPRNGMADNISDLKDKSRDGGGNWNDKIKSIKITC